MTNPITALIFLNIFYIFNMNSGLQIILESIYLASDTYMYTNSPK